MVASESVERLSLEHSGCFSDLLETSNAIADFEMCDLGADANDVPRLKGNVC